MIGTNLLSYTFHELIFMVIADFCIPRKIMEKMEKCKSLKSPNSSV